MGRFKKNNDASVIHKTHDELATIAYRLAQSGLKDNQLSVMLGLTKKEMQQIASLYPEISEAIEKGRADGLGQVCSNLFLQATKADAKVDAIKAYLSLAGGSDYQVDRPAIQVTNNNLSLPSAKEAIEILMNDPSILEGEVLKDHTLIEAINNE